MKDRGKIIQNSKRGTTMVEAALIFPLVILTVMTVIFILTFMFQEVAGHSRLHLALNAEMGKETGTVETFKNVPAEVRPYKSFHGVSECYLAEKDLRFTKKGLLSGSFTKVMESRVYSVDEKKFIRYTDFFLSET